MKNFTHRISIVAGIVLLVVFNITQVHTKPGAPPAGGLSGDPSRTSCALIGCHPGPELSFGAGELDFNMGVTQGNLTPATGQTYTPGQTYFIEFKPNVTNGANTRYGFQTTTLDVPGNMAGAFIITDAANSSAQSLLSRNYIGHKNASAFHDWNFQWTAPATNVGKVTFYYAVDDADNNGGTSGDKIYKGSVDLLPNTGTGIANTEVNSSITVFPNPAKQNLFVSFNSADENPVDLNVFSADGKLIQTKTERRLSAGENVINLELNEWMKTGVYILEITTDGKKVTRRFVVM